MRVVTFSNLFPSSVMPTHGLFVQERMRRVVAAGGFDWAVVAPVPRVPWPLRRGVYRRWAAVPEVEQVDGVTVHHPRFTHWPGLSMRRQARAVADGARARVAALCAEGDVVLDAHYLWPDGVAAAALAQELGVPFTLTARGSDVNVLADDPFVAACIAAAAPRAHARMAVSDALAARFAAVAGLGPEQVVTVRNGVDLDRFAPAASAEQRRAARRQLALPEHGKLVVGVGRLVAGKRFDLAAAAVAALANVTLALVGDGDERARIERVGGGRVCFLGARGPDEVALAYRAADAFVLPSEREGWPNVVTEALASGLPVVATRVGGVPQILGAAPPPHLGALVDVGDLRGLTDALRAVLAAAPRPGDVRAFAERYGWQQPVAQLVATFEAARSEEVA